MTSESTPITRADLTRIDGHLTDLDGRMYNLETRVAVIEVRVTAIDKHLTEIDGRLSGIELRIGGFLTALAELRGSLEAGMERLRADMHKQDAAMKAWMLMTVLTIIGTMVLGFGSLMLNINNTFRPTVPPASAPITFNLAPPAAVVESPPGVGVNPRQ